MSENQAKAKERAAVLRRLETSGQSMAEFCREQGLSYGTVATWRGLASRQRPVDWVEVQAVGGESLPAVADPVVEAGDIAAELSLPGGVVLRIYREAGSC